MQKSVPALHGTQETSPDHEKPKEIHRFWSRKSARESSKSAQILKIVIFALWMTFQWNFSRNGEIWWFLVHFSKMGYFGGQVLEWLYFLRNFNDSGHPFWPKSIKVGEIPLLYVNFMNFHKSLRNCKNPSPRPTGHRKPAQTMKNLRNYIGSGGGNQVGDHQNQPRSSKIIIAAFWVVFWWNPSRSYKFLWFSVYFSKIWYFGGQVLKCL